MKKLSIILVVILGLLVSYALAQVITYYLPSSGNVTITGATFTWEGTSTPVTNLDWGTVDNNIAYDMAPIRVTNMGNTPITLTLATQDLSQTITTLTLTWNYDNTPIPANGGYAIIIFAQTIIATGPFTYNVAVTATSVESP